jgi:hypothetical protein
MKTAEFKTVTPDMARDWLAAHNKDNRAKRGWWFEAIASAILRGEWITTHQGIAFSKSGKLIDGQHRLSAIEKTGVSIEMLVVTGIDDAAFGVIDCGIKRTTSDLTGLSKRTAEAARLAANFVYSGTVSSAQVLEVANGGLVEVHDALIEHCGSARAFYTSAPMRLAAVSLVMDGHSRDHVFKCYADLVLERYSEMPLIAQSLVRQVNAGTARAGRPRDLYARGLKALSPQYAQISKLQISEAEIEAASAYGRSIFKRSIGAE